MGNFEKAPNELDGKKDEKEVWVDGIEEYLKKKEKDQVENEYPPEKRPDKPSSEWSENERRFWNT